MFWVYPLKGNATGGMSSALGNGIWAGNSHPSRGFPSSSMMLLALGWPKLYTHAFRTKHWHTGSKFKKINFFLQKEMVIFFIQNVFGNTALIIFLWLSSDTFGLLRAAFELLALDLGLSLSARVVFCGKFCIVSVHPISHARLLCSPPLLT